MTKLRMVSIVIIIELNGNVEVPCIPVAQPRQGTHKYIGETNTKTDPVWVFKTACN